MSLKKHPDWQVINLDKLTYAGNLKNLEDIQEDSRYKFVRGDIADRNLVDRLFSQERFDVVVNFAAESHVDRSILDPSPFIETNVKGVQVLLEAARKYPVWRFVQISTDEVYGSLGPEESSPKNHLLCPTALMQQVRLLPIFSAAPTIRPMGSQ